MTRCEDARGIDVALLYQPARFRLLEHRSIRVPSREHGLHPTRDILYAKGLALSAEGLDTLHVLVAHLPSRAGGYEGDRNRRLAADVLWTTVDSILSSRKRTGREVPRVVLMGDFNADRHDRVFRRAPLRMTDDAKAQGTYCYQGLWQWIDHILVSSSLATDAPAHPVSYPWLLEENKTYDGQMPRRTYRGPTYHGGISDHLPIVSIFQIKGGVVEASE
jgi:endonuclease/exonuclease/phosphatase family metal-dependent hydrolase